MDLFISDLHLHVSRPQTTQRFIDFAAGPARDAASLTILGDLFEYWAGDDDISAPLHAHVCAAIRTLTDAGIPTRFMHGNRDLLIGEGFCTATGATLLTDPSLHPVGGIPTLLLHGDTLCTDDVDYQRYRSQVHDPAFIAAFLQRSLDDRKAFIASLRNRSETEKQAKAAMIMDVNADAVAQAFRSSGVARMIHGHTHRRARHNLMVDGRACERWVLGDWGHANDEGGNFLECRRNGWAFRSWDGRRATALD
jgi:UDP-2,3-diacylglucosamine hydrolase